MYADKRTESIDKAVAITEERRAIQETYNAAHGITPTTVKRENPLLAAAEEAIDAIEAEEAVENKALKRKGAKVRLEGLEGYAGHEGQAGHEHLTLEEIQAKVKQYEQQMKQATKAMEFEEVARCRDLMRKYLSLEVAL